MIIRHKNHWKIEKVPYTPPSEHVADTQLVKPSVGPCVPSSEQVTTWERIPSSISEQSCSFCELVRDSRGSPCVLVGGPEGSTREGMTGAIGLDFNLTVNFH